MFNFGETVFQLDLFAEYCANFSRNKKKFNSNQ